MRAAWPARTVAVGWAPLGVQTLRRCCISRLPGTRSGAHSCAVGVRAHTRHAGHADPAAQAKVTRRVLSPWDLVLAPPCKCLFATSGMQIRSRSAEVNDRLHAQRKMAPAPHADARSPGSACRSAFPGTRCGTIDFRPTGRVYKTVLSIYGELVPSL